MDKHQLFSSRPILCRGFTLLELVIVIVLLGILAAVAIPNFGDISEDAKQSTADGVAGAAAAAAANAAAKFKGGLGGAMPTCATVGALIDTGGATIGGTDPNCTVTYEGKTAHFKIPG